MLAGDPGHQGGLWNLARLLSKEARRDEAAEVLRQEISLYPASVMAITQLGWIRSDEGQPEEAEAAARRAIELNPRHADAWSLLASALSRKPGAADEAMAASDESVRLDPESEFAYSRRTRVATVLGRWRVAETAAAVGLKLAPQDLRCLFSAAEIKTRLARFDEAEAAFASVLQLDHSPHWINAVLGSLEHFGVPEPLTDVYTRACEAVGRPDLTVPGAAGADADLLLAQARLAVRMLVLARDGHPWSARRRETARELTAATRSIEGSGSIWYQLAGLGDHEDGNPDAILECLRVRGERGWIMLTWTYGAGIDECLRHGEVREALELADEAVGVHPYDGFLMGLRARALCAAGRLDEALPAAHEAVALWPDSPDPLVELAAVQRKTGSPHKALASLTEAMELAYVPAHRLIALDRAELLMDEFGVLRRVERELTEARLPPSGGRRRFLLGRARYLTGKWTRAAVDFAALLDDDTTDRDVLAGVRDTLAPTRGYGPFLDVYLGTLTRLGEPDPGEFAEPEALADLAARLLRAYAASGDAEPLRWAGTLAADAFRLNPRHTPARRVASVAFRPRSPESREVLAALRAERPQRRRPVLPGKQSGPVPAARTPRPDKPSGKPSPVSYGRLPI